MKRTAVNPWDWSLKLGYNQAEIIEGATRQVVCAGQTAVDDQGHPQHPGDMRAQISLALDCAATEFFRDGQYHISGEGKVLSPAQMSDYLAE